MGTCPICNSVADVRESSGDFKQFDCPRCGRYRITGTALAMLPARLETDKVKARARLSHAVRGLADKAPADSWPEISSVNLDELVKSPLPSIEHQILNLLRWAAKQLGDDQIGVVQFPKEEYLAGIVGTIDGDRTDTLIALATKDGLIELVSDDCMRVTRRGWEKLAPADAGDEATAPSSVQAKPLDEPEIVKVHCNRCNGVRKFLVCATHTVPGRDGDVSWSHTFDILECRGCEQISVRHEFWFSEWDEMGEDSHGNPVLEAGIKTTFWPPPIRRPKPKWSSQLSDDVLRTLFDELYVALDSDLLVLSTIGARTLFDRASFLQVRDPPGGFAGKMQAMQAAGHISANEKKILEAMTDAGSASAHRGHSPTFEQLTSIVNILENYIERAFILGHAADSLRKSTPQRPPRKKK